MKKQLLFAALLLAGSSAFAQSYRFEFKGVELEDNAEVTVDEALEENWGDDEDPYWIAQVESHLSLKNVSGSALLTKGSINFLSAVPSGGVSFCFDMCVKTDKDSSQEKNIEAGSYLSGFHVAFEPEYQQYGSLKIKLKAENKSDASDSRTVYVNFNYKDMTGIASNKANVKSSIYQQGASLILNASLDKPAVLSISDITGKQIVNRAVEDGTTVLSSLPKGIYIYSLQSGNEIIGTNKFIVR